MKKITFSVILLISIFNIILADCQDYEDDPYGLCNTFDLCDLNNDGSFNILDIIITLTTILSTQYDECADLNNDSLLNILDIIIMINVILDG